MSVRLGIFFLAWACAQIQITASDLPSAGTTYIVSQSRPQPGIDFTATGPNYTWDFSQLPSDTQLTIAWKHVWEAPQYTFSCGNASLQALLLKIADSFPSPGGISIRDIYAFLRKGTSALTVQGIGASVNGLPLTPCYQDPDEVYVLPLTYGQNDSTTFWLRFSFPAPVGGGTITLAQRGYRLHRVDGYGPTQTPYTQKVCLRLRQDVHQKDTLYYNGIPLQQRDSSYTEFQWLAQEEGVPLLRVQGNWSGMGGAFVPVLIQYKNTLSPTALLGGGSSVRITPNPTQGSLWVSPPHGRYLIRNLLGQMVAEGEVSPEGQIRLPAHLSEGVYFLRLTQNSQTTWHRFWLIR
ncbi:MAG: T9SS type A sorting domain-containing protein [Bacteroidia bacterium]|jgi:hypothetical protein|nr:T9SS type A sorting domain-containing protein [Bacteroidia bacterium]GIV22565.1 MAG: hypothetical protein KatS3mg025_0224 [Bacteroidia bacterium]